MRRSWWVVAASLASSVAMAEESTPPASVNAPASEEDREHKVAVTFSPIHLFMPIFEVTGEFRAANKIGLAAVVGVGSVNDVAVVETGGQFRFYPIGNFNHGMQLGAEIQYVFATASSGDIFAVAGGLSAGPFIGYKIATNVGFTFEAQAGVAVNTVNASASGSGVSTSSTTSSVGPLLNLNIGWSFGR
ncbi:MAG: hypothetical protein WBV82_21595 [Myxococcaceae bacterium]